MNLIRFHKELYEEQEIIKYIKDVRDKLYRSVGIPTFNILNK